MRLNSIAVRMFATSAAWMLLVLPLAGGLIFALFQDDVENNFDNNLVKLVDGITLDALATAGVEPTEPPNRYEPLFEVEGSGFYWQIKPVDLPQAKRLSSKSLGDFKLPSPSERNVKPDRIGKYWMNSTGPDGKPIRLVEIVTSLGFQADTPRYSVIVSGPYDWIEDVEQAFRERLFVALTLAGLGLLAATLVQIRFGLAPLRRVEQGLAAIRSGDARELKGDLPVEIEPLKQELNALMKSNDEIIERARTQVGNLAHALKTPLAVITNEARDPSPDFAETVAEQAAMMRDQVNNYLDRARLSGSANVIGRATPVLPVAESLARALARIHRDRDIEISCHGSHDLRFQGEKQDLEEMLGNLLDNACKWCASKVNLAAELLPQTARGSQKRLVITVEDDGAGLTAEQRAKIGKRGLRLDETKPGSGLGLSIVADFATSYRGTMTLEVSPMGGLLVRLELPAA